LLSGPQVLTLIKRLSDNQNTSSLANSMRRNRCELFKDDLLALPIPVRVLDAGGTESFWEQIGLADQPSLEITLLNLQYGTTKRSNFDSIQGDARDLSQFSDSSFDFVVSNSVIEHVGTQQDKLRMANEIRRVAKRYFVQTPNFWFPFEPHFLFPGFQFLPFRLQVALVQRYNLGWVHREENLIAAQNTVKSVELLTKQELKTLFPEARIHHEKFWGITKSLIAFHWPDNIENIVAAH
jgi:hypothetical protein